MYVRGLLASKSANAHCGWGSRVPKVFAVHCNGCAAGLARKFGGDGCDARDEGLAASAVEPQLGGVVIGGTCVSRDALCGTVSDTCHMRIQPGLAHISTVSSVVQQGFHLMPACTLAEYNAPVPGPLYVYARTCTALRLDSTPRKSNMVARLPVRESTQPESSFRVRE